MSRAGAASGGGCGVVTPGSRVCEGWRGVTRVGAAWKGRHQGCRGKEGGRGPFLWRIFVSRGWGGWRVPGPPRLALSRVGPRDARARGWVSALLPRVRGRARGRPGLACPPVPGRTQLSSGGDCPVAVGMGSAGQQRPCVQGGCWAHGALPGPILTQKYSGGGTRLRQHPRPVPSEQPPMPLRGTWAVQQLRVPGVCGTGSCRRN